MSITIKDIAKIAGVSHTTVIKALKDRPKVSAELKQRIKQIAEMNNYVVNLNARNLALKENKVIGLVITDITIPLFGELTKAVEEVARSHGYNVIICCSENDERQENEVILNLLELRVAGVIVTPCYKSNEFVNQLQTAQVPFIILGKLDGVNTDYITFDDRMATYRAAKYLLEIGHRKIACICPGNVEVYPFKYWIEGYKKALEEECLEFNNQYVFDCDISPDSGYNIVRDILSLPERPTALISFIDTSTIGLMRGLRDNGIIIPQQMSVITLQDNDIFKYYTPSLTAVSFPKHKLGQLSAEYLVKKIKHNKTDIRNFMLSPELIIRESTCRNV